MTVCTFTGGSEKKPSNAFKLGSNCFACCQENHAIDDFSIMIN
ncbi:hypothetical protein D039_0664 [Vibrio parahaemolyticus EKP-028]|nr:hypothetical protein D039_0664 [Vibrio parahaemolyticus EKP-028]